MFHFVASAAVAGPSKKTLRATKTLHETKTRVSGFEVPEPCTLNPFLGSGLRVSQESWGV